MTLSGIEYAIFRLVAQCLNQLLPITKVGGYIMHGVRLQPDDTQWNMEWFRSSFPDRRYVCFSTPSSASHTIAGCTEVASCSRNKATGTYLLIYLLTPWSRVLLEKLTCSQLIKNFPTFYGTRRFIVAFTSARHMS
jgi:hypothetical protein